MRFTGTSVRLEISAIVSWSVTMCSTAFTGGIDSDWPTLRSVLVFRWGVRWERSHGRELVAVGAGELVRQGTDPADREPRTCAGADDVARAIQGVDPKETARCRDISGAAGGGRAPNRRSPGRDGYDRCH